MGAYLALACLASWPAVIELGRAVPGARRTDLWNSLWSIWFVGHSLAHDRLPFHTTLIGAPHGGNLLVSDPLGTLFGALLLPLVGLPVAYTLLVLWRLTVSGVVAHLFATDLLEAAELPIGGAWIAGVGYATAPVLLSGVHNGTSEAFAGGGVALSAWTAWRAARFGGSRRAVLAGLCLVLAAVGSWYGAVCAFLFAGALLVVGLPGRWRTTLSARASALAVGFALTAPLAAGVHAAATRPGNLVGIKRWSEVASVRRTTGPADPVGYFAWGDYRSPDFRVISRYGEEFFHCHYLGWTLIFGSLMALGARRRRGTAWLWLGGGLGFALSLGPVLVRFGSPVIVMVDRAIPLPYILVERLPGFASLSLLFRLAQAPALAAALLAACGLAGRRVLPRGMARWSPAVVVLAILLEGRFLSPLHGLPDTVSTSVAPAIEALRDAPEGAVMNFPVVGGRRYLFEQTVHHKPIAGGLNFPNDVASQKVWKEMIAKVDRAPDEFRRAVAKEAQKVGVRYLVVHVDPMARPDLHDTAVRAVKKAFDPLPVAGAGDEGGTVRVYPLW